MTTEAFNFGNPSAPDNSDGGQVYVLACEWEAGVAGSSLGGRWRCPTNAPGITTQMLLYRKSDMALLASKTFTPSAGVDNDVLFDSAVSVAANARYVTGVLTDRYAATASYGWPATTTNLTAPAGVNGRLATTTAGNPVYPGTISGNASNFHIGPLWEATGATITGTAVANLGTLAGAVVGLRTVVGTAVAGLGRVTTTIAGLRTVGGTALGNLRGLTATATTIGPSRDLDVELGAPYTDWHVGQPHL